MVDSLIMRSGNLESSAGHLGSGHPTRFGSKFFLILVETIIIAVAVFLLIYLHLLVYGKGNDYVLIGAIGFGLALLDSSMAMGYGTIGTPVLVLLGFSPKLVVPSILISQMVAASISSFLHHSNKNVNYFDRKKNDSAILFRLLVFGIAGVIIAVFLVTQISKEVINIYIGSLVTAMGMLLLAKPKFEFSWARVNLISLISGFNKAISGGGYGLVATTGLLVSGNPVRESVGITLFSVAILNSVAFAGWYMTGSIESFQLAIFLIIGGMLGSQIGPLITNKANSPRTRVMFACVATALGVFTVISSLI
ncbi:MAG: sulfite exporter TauE/SafE family protein [Thermoplasmatales archaeon]